MHAILLLGLVLLQTPPTPRLSRVAVQLPGATGAVALDYLAAERSSQRVWIPAGETGSVDVLDVATHKVVRIGGFATQTGGHGWGPSAISLGQGLAFVGDRASSEICAIDAQKLVKLGCAPLPTMPDGVQAVSATREVWVTTPADRSITVLDGSALPGGAEWPARRQTSRIPLPGRPEGYAVDDERGRFFTNLEDRNETVAIDVRSRKVVSTWPVPCGEQGPRGLAHDQARRFLFVACTDKVLVLDEAHAGTLLSTLATGAGVDNVDYLAAQVTLYVAAGKAARLTMAHVDAQGSLAVVASEPTVAGARVVVAASDGTAVVGDPRHGGVLLFSRGR